MRMQSIVVGACALACFAGSASAMTNILNNPGFESPLGFDFADQSNWNGFFGGQPGTFLQAFNDTGAAPRSGNNALVTTIRGSATTNGFDGFTGHVQLVSVISPGALYELAVWARTNPSINTGAEFRVEWIGAGGEISRTNVTIDTALTSEYQRFSVTDIAPAGATSAKIVLAVQSFFHTGPIADTSVAWDDASFGIIPAPGAAAVLGLGALLVGRRRR